MTDTRQALLPCPFCGHKTPTFERMGTPRQSCIVECGNCGCRHESGDEGSRSGSSWNERAALAAQHVAGAGATEPSEEIQELRAQVEAWRKQYETLTNQVICCGVAARHPDATLTTRGAYAGKWNSPQAEEVRKLRAERDALLAAAPQPAPSAQAVAHPSHQTVREWMPVSEALRLSDLWTAGDLDNCGQWRAAIKVLADEVRALAASPQPAQPSAQGEAVAWYSPPELNGFLPAIVRLERDASSKRVQIPLFLPEARVEAMELTDKQIDRIAENCVKAMPDGIQGFCNTWGWRQFARELLDICRGHYRASAPAAPAQPSAQGEAVDE